MSLYKFVAIIMLSLSLSLLMLLSYKILGLNVLSVHKSISIWNVKRILFYTLKTLFILLYNFTTLPTFQFLFLYTI